MREATKLDVVVVADVVQQRLLQQLAAEPVVKESFSVQA
jgi:hypothetical protein